MKKLLLLTSFCIVAFAAITHADDNDLWKNTLVFFSATDIYPTPNAADNHGYYNWGQCWDKQDDNQPIGPNDTNFIPKACEPDTLYSWGGPHKMQMLSTEAPAGKQNWNPYFSKEIFAHINPVATFGYGPIAFRFKLRPGTGTLLYSQDQASTADNSICKLYTLEQQQHNIVVRVWVHGNTDGVDYIICSPLVIDSWSYDTRSHYDEIVASVKWNQTQLSQNGENWIPYVYVDHESKLLNTDLDDLDWSRGTLIKDLLAMQTRAAANKGKIIYGPGVPNDIVRHFSTTRPIYWNHGHDSPAQ